MRLDDLTFPDSKALKSGGWRPIFFSPNLDSPERLVVGILCNLAGDWYLEEARAIERLKCLYGDESKVAIEAIRVGLAAIQNQLSTLDSIDHLRIPVSGISKGDTREAQGVSAQNIAQRWLPLISSLHGNSEMLPSEVAQSTGAASGRVSRDRLAMLVMKRMETIHPVLADKFHPYIRRLRKSPYARRKAGEVFVAYQSSKVNANFSTVSPQQRLSAVDSSKRLMWDLERYRDESHNLRMADARYQFYLHKPVENDPNVSPRQMDRILNAVETLTEEGKRGGIEVLKFSDVNTMTDKLVSYEAA